MKKSALLSYRVRSKDDQAGFCHLVILSLNPGDEIFQSLPAYPDSGGEK